MIRTAIKHYLVDYALDIAFNRILPNFTIVDNDIEDGIYDWVILVNMELNSKKSQMAKIYNVKIHCMSEGTYMIEGSYRDRWITGTAIRAEIVSIGSKSRWPIMHLKSKWSPRTDRSRQK